MIGNTDHLRPTQILFGMCLLSSSIISLFIQKPVEVQVCPDIFTTSRLVSYNTTHCILPDQLKMFKFIQPKIGEDLVETIGQTFLRQKIRRVEFDMDETSWLYPYWRSLASLTIFLPILGGLFYLGTIFVWFLYYFCIIKMIFSNFRLKLKMFDIHEVIRTLILLRYLHPDVFLGLWVLLWTFIGFSVLVFQNSPWFWYQLIPSIFFAFVSGTLFMAPIRM